jgi:hypothetical protein
MLIRRVDDEFEVRLLERQHTKALKVLEQGDVTFSAKGRPRR